MPTFIQRTLQGLTRRLVLSFLVVSASAFVLAACEDEDGTETPDDGTTVIETPTSDLLTSPTADDATGSPTTGSPTTGSPTTGSPTASPMASPVGSPTGSPVASPTASPQASPTGSPVASPTGSPIAGSPTVTVTGTAGAVATTLSVTGAGDGPVMVLANDRPVYIRTDETRDTIQCIEECLDTWEPVLTTSEDVEAEGITAEVGTVEREGGQMQVTIGDKPVYYFVGDTLGSDTPAGQGVGAIWYVVDAEGEPIEEGVPSSSTPAGGGLGGLAPIGPVPQPTSTAVAPQVGTPTGTPTGTPEASPTPSQLAEMFELRSTDLMRDVIYTADGKPVYARSDETSEQILCVGECLQIWQPVMAEEEDAGTPTASPTGSPVASPTGSPVASPTGSPEASPTGSPVASPTASPQASPTGSPVASPTASPQASPTGSPVASPTPSALAEMFELRSPGLMSDVIYTTKDGKPVYARADELEDSLVCVDDCLEKWEPIVAEEDANGTPTASPQASPVASPTGTAQASPTASPAASPTASPQASPTGSPVASPTASPQASPTGSPVASPTSGPRTIVDAAIADGRFTTLVAALTAAGLDETLAGEGPFTVFAPTDDAFDALPPGTVDELLDDIPALTDVLLYHVVEGAVPASDVVTVDSVKTLQGQEVTVRVENGDVFINDAQVLITDIETSNGIIHVIDAVLVPETEGTVTAEFGTVDRDGGSQVTINGQPVYTFIGDLEQTTFPVGQLFGPWSLLDAEGELAEEELPVTGTPTASPTASPSPQASPTASPQASPTASPVASPTASPQASPTGSPVASPTGSPVASPTASPVASPTAPAETILEIAEAAGEFNVLIAALEAAGLDETLSGEGPFTVFAPTDEAFAALPPGMLAELLQDIPSLTSVLTYHVVGGTVLAADVAELNSATTLQGGEVSIQVVDGEVMINDATVVIVDLQGSNGVIHVIDSVLVPEEEEMIDAEFGTVDRDGVMQVTINRRPVYTYTGDVEDTEAPVGQFFIPWSLLGADGQLIDRESEEFTPATPTASPSP